MAKEQSESINERRTDKTMAKRKRTKKQTTIYKTLHKTKLSFSCFCQHTKLQCLNSVLS